MNIVRESRSTINESRNSLSNTGEYYNLTNFLLFHIDNRIKGYLSLLPMPTPNAATSSPSISVCRSKSLSSMTYFVREIYYISLCERIIQKKLTKCISMQSSI